MKGVKYIVIGIFGLSVVVGVAVFFLVQNLDSIVKGAIEKYGSQATGTAVRVQKVDIGLKSGRGSVQGLRVANPAGFSGNPIFSLGDISLVLDTASLTSELPTIRDIHIGAPKVLYEANQKGDTNLRIIKKNIEAFARTHGGKSQDQAPAQGKGKEPRFLVKRLVVEQGQADLDLTAVGGERIQGKLGTITLTDIGGRDGTTAAELSQVVLKALVKKLERTAAREGAERLIRQKLGGIGKDIDEKVGSEIRDAGDSLKKMLGK